MFNLFRSRNKAVRYTLGAVLLLVALAMVVTLIPGFMSFGGGGENIVAEIGSEALTVRDVQRNIQDQLRNKTFPREMASVYVPIIINQMISERAVAYEAERLGFEVTDADVALTVQSLLPQLFPGGKFVGKEIYAQQLAQMNLTIPEFEDNVRKQMLLIRLTNLAIRGEVVTDEEIEAEYRKGEEKIKIDYIAISPADLRSEVKLTVKEMRDYFEKNQNSFKIGEKRDARILVVDQDEIAKTVSAPEEALRKAYEASKDRFRTPERVKVRHILIMTANKPADQKAKLKVKAEDILKQLKAGADFAELAKKYSDDTGTAAKGGELGWIVRGQTVANFENTAFRLKPGELSDVISTEYGFHIVQVEKKEKAHLKPFEEVKDELASEHNKQLIYDKMQSLADQAHAELIKNPLQADEIAKRLGLIVYKVNKVSLTDSIPEVGGSADMQEAIRTLPRGGVSPVYQMGESRLGMAVVTETYPERPAKFAEVEDQLRQVLISRKVQELAAKKQKKLEELLSKEGADLDKIARKMGLKVKRSPEFTRSANNVEGLGAATYMLKAFEEPVGAIVGPLNAMGNIIVCKVVAKIPADMTKLAAQRERIATEIRKQKAKQRQSLFEDGILAKLINDGKLKINNRTIKRIVSNYTS